MTDAAVITGKDELIAWLAAGCKPKSHWRIGTEHEKFAFTLANNAAVAYAGEDGIAAMLQTLTRFGWKPLAQNGNLIGLAKDSATIALEPGGQIELSGAPLATLHDADREISQHLAELRQVAEPFGIGFLGLGFQPTAQPRDLPWVPKSRYRIMHEIMSRTDLPTRRGLDMMQRTASIQVNLDYASERDMARKMRVSTALQPLTLALFAASPLLGGKPTGYKSWRMQVWQGTSVERAGLLPFVFDRDFTFEGYVDYALDLPMYFLWRDGHYIDAEGQTFRDFLETGLDAYPDTQPTIGDWADHLSTLFPDVRLRHYIEMRSADCGPRPHLTALPAFWTGLLYDEDALAETESLVQGWSYPALAQLREDAARFGLEAKILDRSLQSVAKDALAIAQKGLKRRHKLREPGGPDESRYLDCLFEIAQSGKTVADDLLDHLGSDWQGDPAPLFARYRL